MTIWVPVVQGHCSSWKDPELSNAMMLIIIKISFWEGLSKSYRAKLSLPNLSIYVYTHTHTYISLLSTIKERRKRKCLVVMIFLNWVNSKHAQSKMKINDYLFFFFATLFIFPHGWQRLTLKQKQNKDDFVLAKF